MGLVKFGGGVVQISGSIAGTVYARNRSGNYIRPRTKPINPRSARQEAIKAIMSYLAEYWHEVLTPVNREGWDVYAAAIAMKNRLGETIHLTGFNHFIRMSASRMTYDPTTVIWQFPTILALPEKDNQLVLSDEDIAAQTLTFICDVNGWGVGDADKKTIVLYQGRPQLASRMFFAGPWRFLDIIDATEGAAGTGTYDAVFPFAAGQKQWVQARVMTADGRLSEVWMVEPRTLVAD